MPIPDVVYCARTGQTSLADLKKALEPFEKIRKAVGDKVERWSPGDKVCALTNGGGNPPAISHIAFFGGVRAVPEPATWAMFLIGFGAVGYSMRKRQGSGHRVQAV